MRKSLAVLFILALTAFSAAAQSAAIPPAPILTSPSDGETVNTHSPLLTWTGSADATLYKIVVKNSVNAKVMKLKINTADACAGNDCAVSPSLNGVDFLNDTFTWKVVAKSADGKASSPKITFTVDFPGTPVLLSPAADTTTGSNPQFTWEPVPAAEEYRVKLKHTGTGEKLVSGWTSAGTLCSGNCAYTFPNGLDAGVYKWQVHARQTTFPNVSKTSKITWTVGID